MNVRYLFPARICFWDFGSVRFRECVRKESGVVVRVGLLSRCSDVCVVSRTAGFSVEAIFTDRSLVSK